MGPIGVGSDGGGSIRQPASFCGILGFKPSFGRIPCEPPSGTIGTFNAIGILARTTADVATALDVLAGEDEADWHSLPRPPGRYADALAGALRGVRVAWSPDLGYAAVDPVVREIAGAAARRFADELGCTVEEADPGWSDPADWFEILCMRMMAVGLRGYLGEWRELMDPALVEFIAGRGEIAAEDIADAAGERIDFQARSRRFFERFDLLLTPTMAVLPFATGVVRPARIAGRAVRGMQWTPFTYPFNANGYPAASVPGGWTADGLPVGLQIAGPFRDDALVLRACAAFEAVSAWRQRVPSVTSP
jgi:aspartyl-tRNA(Asn)/glutamyl-tRNA(Gln) amidotransferase subunit A